MLIHLIEGFSSIDFRLYPSPFRELLSGLPLQAIAHVLLSAKLIAEWFTTLSLSIFPCLPCLSLLILWYLFTGSAMDLKRCFLSPGVDENRITPSRIPLYACSRRVISTSWYMDLNQWCSDYKYPYFLSVPNKTTKHSVDLLNVFQMNWCLKSYVKSQRHSEHVLFF